MIPQIFLPIGVAPWKTAICAEFARLVMAGNNPTTTSPPLEAVIAEVEKVKAQIRAVTTELKNPDLEFPVLVRLSVRLRELEAYLAGLLYAIGEAARWEGMQGGHG